VHVTNNFRRCLCAARHWAALLPAETPVDILLTHGPPRDTGDVTSGGEAVGDAALRDAVLRLQAPPLVWVVGHIHASHGVYGFEHPCGRITVINAATNDLSCGRDTRPVVVDVRTAAVTARGVPDGRTIRGSA
jgi:Icc-related predicted phosphoesterase